MNVYPKLSNWKSLWMEPPFAHCTMVKSLIKEIDDGPYSTDHYKFISWKPTTLNCAIDSRGPIRSIKHLRVMGFHHVAAAATGKHRHSVSTMHRLANRMSNIRRSQNQPKFNHCPTSYLHQYLSYGDIWNTHPVHMHRRRTHARY
jgi:hypothetical protein